MKSMDAIVQYVFTEVSKWYQNQMRASKDEIITIFRMGMYSAHIKQVQTKVVFRNNFQNNTTKQMQSLHNTILN